MKKIITLLALAFCLHINAQVCFSPLIALPNPITNSAGSIIANADFNNDGKQDLVVTGGSTYPKVLNIALGLGNGSFNVSYFTTTDYSNLISVADFNNDNNADIAASDNSRISVYLGDGTGNFGTAISYTIANPSITSIINGDFNNDGKIDLAVANSSANNISVLLNTSTGTVTASFANATNYFVCTAPNFIICKDFNNDGKLDLVVSNGSANFSFLKGTGTGSFNLAVNIPQTVGRPSVSDDFNNDGNADLAGADHNGSAFFVQLGTGTGSFGAQTSYQFTPSTYSSFAISGDYNGDGKQDIIMDGTLNGGVYLDLNKGAGSFETTYYSAFCNVASSIISADFNNDGRLDIAVGCNGSGVFLNLPSPTVTAITNTVNLCVDSMAVLTASGANTYTWSSYQYGSSISITPTITTSYTVTGTDTSLNSTYQQYGGAFNGCTNTATIIQTVTNCGAAGIKSFANSALVTIYPNPSTDILEVTVGNEQLTEIKIYDITGRLVLSQKPTANSAKEGNSITVDASGLPAGIYNASVTSSMGVVNKRLVIVR